jgi:ribosomal-protein-alanine N-acetyltransferase
MSSVQKPMTTSESLMLMPLARMQVTDIQEVQEIENDVYPFPWTSGNFLDSLYSNYETWVVRDASGGLAGYFLIMLAMDEAHLLNITVRRDLHGHGVGRMLLDQVVSIACEKGMNSVLLEVRPTNTRALRVYERYGFSQIGRRRGYYPAAGNMREDAIVMRLKV